MILFSVYFYLFVYLSTLSSAVLFCLLSQKEEDVIVCNAFSGHDLRTYVHAHYMPAPRV